MNPSLQEINEIIMLCDEMVNFVDSRGNIRNGNSLYNEYKKRINDFVKEQELSQRDYAPYVVLDSFYFSSSLYYLNISEVEMIRRTVIELKHELFPDSFDRIFISHREKKQRSSCRVYGFTVFYWHSKTNCHTTREHDFLYISPSYVFGKWQSKFRGNKRTVHK